MDIPNFVTMFIYGYVLIYTIIIFGITTIIYISIGILNLFNPNIWKKDKENENTIKILQEILKEIKNNKKIEINKEEEKAKKIEILEDISKNKYSKDEIIEKLKYLISPFKW